MISVLDNSTARDWAEKYIQDVAPEEREALLDQYAAIDEQMKTYMYGCLIAIYRAIAESLPEAPAFYAFSDPFDDLPPPEKQPITEGIAWLTLRHGMVLPSGEIAPYDRSKIEFQLKTTQIALELLSMFRPDYRDQEPDVKIDAVSAWIKKYLTKNKTPFPQKLSLYTAIEDVIGAPPPIADLVRFNFPRAESLGHMLTARVTSNLKEINRLSREFAISAAEQMIPKMTSEERKHLKALLDQRRELKIKDPFSQPFLPDSNAEIIYAQLLKLEN